MKKLLIQILAGFAVYSALAQGTLVYDQQSATNDTGGVGSASVNFHTNDVYGESFLPSLSSVDFVRLSLADLGGAGGHGALMYVNLWAGSIGTGTLEASTTPIFIPIEFVGYTNFLFSSSVALTPSTTYYLQPVAQTGSDLLNLGLTAGTAYPNGTAIFNGTANGTFDLWFREGIEVVPEPSITSFVLLGAAGIYFQRRKGNL